MPRSLDQAADIASRRPRSALALVAMAAVIIRMAAALVLDQPLESDALAYFTMAEGLAERGVLSDQFGQHVFYSAGYPLLLAALFAVVGSSVSAVLALNLLLAVLSLWLVYVLAMAAARRVDVALVASLAYTLWLPGIWNATAVAKENLSTPLLLALALCALRISDGRRPMAGALTAGLVWGAALVTGGSALALCAGIAIALLVLWRKTGRFSALWQGGLCFVLGTLVVLAPWLDATDRMVGRPVLSTNGPFNLYLGNNPAATGRFVSVADTPMGSEWEEMRLALGEVGTADRLQAEAVAWIGENPDRAAELAVRKLIYFWLPNAPDAEDFAASPIVSTFRVAEVVQYGLIVLLGLAAFLGKAAPRDDKLILGGMIVAFWLLHAAAYIIVRYRDPAMPLLIVFGSLQAMTWLRHGVSSGAPAHAT